MKFVRVVSLNFVPNFEMNSTYYGVLKCYYDEKMFFLFSADSDFIFGKNAPCQLLRLNFKNKSDFFNYDFSFKLSAITRFCSSRVALRELDREKVTSSTDEFNLSICEPSLLSMQHEILCGGGGGGGATSHTFS